MNAIRERVGWLLIAVGIAILPRATRAAVGSALSMTAAAQKQLQHATIDAWAATQSRPDERPTIH